VVALVSGKIRATQLRRQGCPTGPTIPIEAITAASVEHSDRARRAWGNKYLGDSTWMYSTGGETGASCLRVEYELKGKRHVVLASATNAADLVAAIEKARSMRAAAPATGVRAESLARTRTASGVAEVESDERSVAVAHDHGTLRR
jgi:hypothetical protein